MKNYRQHKAHWIKKILQAKIWETNNVYFTNISQKQNTR